MDKVMNACISLNSIKEFLILHWELILALYLVATWLYGVKLVRRQAAEAAEVDADVVGAALTSLLFAPFWVPVYLAWHGLDLGGRRLRQNNPGQTGVNDDCG